MQRLGERLSRAVAEGWRPVRSGLAAPTLSIGVTRRSGADQAWEDIYVRADRALYVSKPQGRNRTTVQEEAELEFAH